MSPWATTFFPIQSCDSRYRWVVVKLLSWSSQVVAEGGPQLSWVLACAPAQRTLGHAHSIRWCILELTAITHREASLQESPALP